MKLLLLLIFILRSNNALGVTLPEPDVPNSKAFIGWTQQPYNVDVIDFSKLKANPFTCADKAVQPLSQDQSTKRYHKFLLGEYDLKKLKAGEEGCLVSSGNQCLKADTVQYTVISDVYRDSCGHKFRAFWQVVFLSDDENMGTLCSLGRTFYEKPNSEFPGEIEIGPTYPVNASKFLFFTDLFAEDKY